MKYNYHLNKIEVTPEKYGEVMRFSIEKLIESHKKIKDLMKHADFYFGVIADLQKESVVIKEITEEDEETVSIPAFLRKKDI